LQKAANVEKDPSGSGLLKSKVLEE
jgi:hypothetical protein